MLKNKSIKYINIVIMAIVALFISNPLFANFNKINFIEDTLENGLKVIYHIDKSAPIVSTIVHYRVGSRDENPNLTGFAHFFEHLMFEATDNIQRSFMDRYVQEAGGDLNAHTSFDETVYKFGVPSNQLNLALWIESQRMRKLLVDTIGVETQRGVVKEERKQRNDNSPYGTMFDKMTANIFKNGSYSWTPIGDPDHINKATITQFRAFYDNFYVPNNACLVIAGDFVIDSAKKYVNAYFGQYKRYPEPKREQFKLPPLEKEYREEVKDTKAQLPGVFIGFRGPSLGDEDYYATLLLNDILAAGESSRLYQRLVNNEQSAVAVAAEPMILQYSGLLLFYGIATPGEKISKVESQIFDEIKKIVEKGITDEEFTKAKNIKEAEFIESKKDVEEKAMELARLYSYYGNPSLINTEIEKFGKVKKADIQRVAKKYLDTDKRVILTYIPAEQVN